MCGVNGVFSYRGGRIDLDELRRTREAQAARGPDGAGEYVSDDGGVGFGHRRLSIIDLSEAATQPMASDDGRLIVTFNGEIYNYRELRRELEAEGCVFRSHSDTETLLHLYRRRGLEMFAQLRGMYAFAIFDADKRSLLLARDPLGIKPLYYSDDGATVRFASQVKALVAGGGVATKRSAAGWVGFAIFGSVPEPFTVEANIRCLPAGGYLVVDGRRVGSPRRHFSLTETYLSAEQAPVVSDPQARFREAVADSVRAHMVADVPVGAFLSAGVDSGALVGLMSEQGASEVRTVTLAFRQFRGTRDDEAPLAEATARTYGARHTTRVIEAGEATALLPRILADMDQPSVDGINTWLVSRATRELGLKVAVSGVGGDELLGGYSTFRQIPQLVKLMSAPGASRVAGPLVRLARLIRPGLSPKWTGLAAYGGDYAGAWLLQRALLLPEEVLEALGDPAFVREGLDELRPLALVQAALTPAPRRPFSKVAILESAFYLRNQLLRDADWAGMAHGVEIRTPLVDSALLKAVAPLACGPTPPPGKAWLAMAPKIPLPAQVLNRPKTGFGIPLADWLGVSGAEPPSRRWRQRVEAAWAPN